MKATSVPGATRESASGAPELFYVATGHATFSIGGEDVDAPAGTCVWITDAAAKRTATANATAQLVGAHPPTHTHAHRRRQPARLRARPPARPLARSLAHTCGLA